MEDIIHEILKDGWCVSKFKKHEIVFKMTIPCLECSLLFVFNF